MPCLWSVLKFNSYSGKPSDVERGLCLASLSLTSEKTPAICISAAPFHSTYYTIVIRLMSVGTARQRALQPHGHVCLCERFKCQSVCIWHTVGTLKRLAKWRNEWMKAQQKQREKGTPLVLNSLALTSGPQLTWILIHQVISMCSISSIKVNASSTVQAAGRMKEFDNHLVGEANFNQMMAQISVELWSMVKAKKERQWGFKST